MNESENPVKRPTDRKLAQMKNSLWVFLSRLLSAGIFFFLFPGSFFFFFFFLKTASSMGIHEWKNVGENWNESAQNISRAEESGQIVRQPKWWKNGEANSMAFFPSFFSETTNKKSEITPSDPSSSSWSSSSTSCWLETLCHAAISLASVSASVAVCQVPKAKVTQEVDGRWGGGRKGEEPNW